MKVSVIIPARNAEHTVAETLASVAEQTRQPEEVIVVDDRSTDRTAASADGHSVVSTVLLGEGLGPAAASNLAVRHATGGWIAPLDADDLWPPNRLARGLEIAKQSGAHAVVGMVESFYDPASASGADRGIRYQSGQQVGFLPGAVLLRRDVFLALGGFNEALTTGFFIDFWDRLTRAGYSIARGDFVALLRRIRPGSLSHRTGAARAMIERDFLAVARNAIQRRKSPPA
jgi:glycosyltransferase involved in cell wall biosynthesis